MRKDNEKQMTNYAQVNFRGTGYLPGVLKIKKKWGMETYNKSMRTEVRTNRIFQENGGLQNPPVSCLTTVKIACTQTTKRRQPHEGEA